MTLSEQQRLFVKLIGQFIDWCYASGYELTFGEAWRTPEQAAINASKGIGIKNSLHIQRLAVDLNLWKDGQYISDPAAYAPLGAQWKTMHALARWGGDFKSVDADHFSLEYGGIK